MIGSAFEALLLSFVDCHPEESCKSPRAPKKGKTIKPFRNWALAELLAVVKERGWLPSNLSLKEDWDEAKAQLGDYGEVIRQMRNLVHPARFIEDFPGKRVTKRYVEAMFEILHAAIDHLLDELEPDLAKAVEQDNGGAAGAPHAR